MSIELVVLSNHLILCHPLLLLPSILPSIRVFSNESALCIRWPKYQSFSLSSSPSNEYSGLISFRVDWFDLLAVQGSHQHHNLKPSILRCSAFFMVQLSHPYSITGKAIALTIWPFVGKMISLLFNMLSKFVIVFPPRHKHLLTSWLQSLPIVIFAAQKNKICHCFHFPPLYLPWSHGTRCYDLSIFNVVFQAFSLSSFTVFKRLFSSSSLLAITVISSAYLRLLIVLLAILIPAYD